MSYCLFERNSNTHHIPSAGYPAEINRQSGAADIRRCDKVAISRVELPPCEKKRKNGERKMGFASSIQNHKKFMADIT